MQLIPVNLIDCDERLWPRDRLNEERVSEFAAIYRDEGTDVLPPVLLSGPDSEGLYKLLDGWHRVAAAEEAGLENIPAELWEGSDPTLAFCEAVKRSSISSLPLSWAEKRAAVDRILELRPSLSDREIARTAGVSHPLVAKRRALANGEGTEDDETAGSQERTPPAPPTAEQEAKRLLAFIGRMWEGRGLFARFSEGQAKRQMAKALAQAAAEQWGDDAPTWLERLQSWSGEALQQL